MKSNELKICLVDDNDSFREGLKFFLKSKTNWKIVQEYSSGEDFYNEVNTKELPDIIIMDYQMPGVNGIAVTKEYLFRNPQIKVIAVSMHASKLFLDELIMAGFRGCIQKRNVYTQIIPAITKIMEDELFFTDHLKIYNK